MACLSTYSIGPLQIPPDTVSNPVFTLIGDQKFFEVSLANYSLNPPSPQIINAQTIPFSSIGTPSSGVSGETPTYTYQLPPLSSVAYNAIQSVINYDFQAPTIPAITYSVAKPSAPITGANPSAPPVNYPTSQLLDLPAPPSMPDVVAPSLAYGSRPALQQPKRLHLYLEPLEPILLDDPDSADFEFQPELLTWQDELVFSEDADLQARVKNVLAGREFAPWVSEVVQRLLVSSDTRTLSSEVKQALDKILDDGAARGYSLPTGAVMARTLEVSDRQVEAEYEAAKKVMSEVYAAAMDLLSTAVSQALRVERYHFALYMRYVQQNLKVYRANIQIAAAVYNALASIVNRFYDWLRLHVEAYNAYVDSVLDVASAKAEELSLARVDVSNAQSQVLMYRADVGVYKASADVARLEVERSVIPLDVYAAQIEGAMANLQIVQQNVEAYKQAVRNYSQAFDWLTDKFAAYEAAIRADSSGIQVTSANVDAYRRLWSAEQRRISAYEDYLRSTLSVFNEEMQRFNTAARAQRNYFGLLRSAANSAMQVLSTAVSAQEQRLRAEESKAQANLSRDLANAEISLVGLQVDHASWNLAATATSTNAKLDAALRSIQMRAAGALSQIASSIYQVSFGAQTTSSDTLSGQWGSQQSVSVARRKTWSNDCVETTKMAFG